MRDHIEARLWADHGHQYADHMHRLFVGVKETFERLHAIQFAAPWRRDGSAPDAAETAPRLKIAGLAFSAALTTIVATLALSGAVEAAPLAGLIA